MVFKHTKNNNELEQFPEQFELYDSVYEIVIKKENECLYKRIRGVYKHKVLGMDSYGRISYCEKKDHYEDVYFADYVNGKVYYRLHRYQERKRII